VVIVAAMPWLILLARTSVYRPFRIAGAALTGLAAGAWLAERALGWNNPIGPLVEAAASQALWLLAGVIILTIAATVGFRRQQTDLAIPGRGSEMAGG
jgi:hypothetical protein